jgi:hypothetical protein
LAISIRSAGSTACTGYSANRRAAVAPRMSTFDGNAIFSQSSETTRSMIILISPVFPGVSADSI